VKESGKLDVMTLEISSFQLESIRRFRPAIAVWLGFAHDHLDRYHSLGEYYKAKLRIFENQTADDWAVINLRDRLPELHAKKVTFSAFAVGADFELRGRSHSLSGRARARAR
jgi:UDP-N-acetylmuramoylalanine--D-glutamate ligase